MCPATVTVGQAARLLLADPPVLPISQSRRVALVEAQRPPRGKVNSGTRRIDPSLSVG